MIFGKLDLSSGGMPPQVSRGRAWQTAYDWIRQFQPGSSHGVYELCGKEMYVNVHGYDTQVRSACRYESHRVYVDLQYCLSGGEIVEWHPLGDLSPRDEYDGTKDVIHHHAPARPQAVLWMKPGDFAIFYAEDGHMPKVTDGINPHVEKLVVKIDRCLLD